MEEIPGDGILPLGLHGIHVRACLSAIALAVSNP
jgi:hypothetical protein